MTALISRRPLMLMAFLFVSAGTAIGQTTVGPFSVNITNTSGVLQGQATLDGVPADAADFVAARDAGGNIAGAAQLIVAQGSAFINLTIYGDDQLTTGVDEGITGSEGFTLLLYDASTQQTIELGQDLTGWSNTNGAPMPGFNDTNAVFAFSTPTTTPTTPGTSVTAAITVADGSNSIDVNFGINPNGTDGLDAGIDQTAPPAPPAGAFDARFSLGTEAFLTDIRLDNGNRPTGEITYDLSFDGPNFAAIALSWDPAALAALGTFTMTDAVNGLLFGPLDMTQVASLAMSDPSAALIASLKKVRITANFSPPAPFVANDDTGTTDEDSPLTLTVIGNDVDPGGGTISVTAVTQGANGSVVNNNDGTVTYTPGANFNGSDTFTYTASNGASTDDATVSVTVTPVNDGPVASDDTGSGDEDTAINVAVLGNDTDPENDALSVTAKTDGANGTVVIETNGTVTYTPGADFNGSDTFTYTVSDGTLTATANVQVTVNPVNDAPVAVDDTISGDEDTGINVPVLTNDSDVDRDPLSVTAKTDGTNGTVAIETDGTVTYTPVADFSGSDSFSYTISDGTLTATANVQVTVNPVNDAPVAVDDSGSGDEDTPIAVSVLTNDTDTENDALSVSGTTTPANGTVAVSGGTITYTPTPDFNGSDSFDYTVSDGNGGTDTGTVSITVNPINDNPVAVTDNANTDVGVPVDITPLTNDTDVDGDTPTLTGVGTPTHGTATFTGGTVTYTPGGTFAGQDSFTYDIADGNGGTATGTINISALNAVDDALTVEEDGSGSLDPTANDTDPENDPISVTGVGTPANGTATFVGNDVTYTPNANFNGTDTFTYDIADGTGSAGSGSITVTVTPVNDGPVASDDTGSGDEDTSINVAVLGNDTDPENDALSVTAKTDGANGTVVIETNGTVTYTPGADFNGSDTFTYTVSDGTLTATANVQVTVNPVNDAPVAVDDTISGDEDTGINVPVLTNDSDVDRDPLSVTAKTDGTNGTVAIETDGTVTYTPVADFSGSDSFSYTISDGTLTATATVQVTVNPVNDAPVAIDDSGSGDEDTPISVTVLANDTDTENDALSVSGTTPPANGTVAVTAGTVTYTPAQDFNGSDSFDYTVSDGNGGTDTGTVSVTVNPVNDNPVAVTDNANTDVGVPVDITPLTNDTDVDGDTPTLTGVGTPTHGTATFTGGTVTYTPGGTFAGQDSFTYDIADGNGGTATGTINISALNAVDDVLTVDEDGSGSLDPTANDTDPENDPISVTGVGTPANGTATFAGNDVTYTPNANFNGTDTFTYDIADGTGSVGSGTVTVTVTAVNDAPVATDDAPSGDEDTVISIEVLGNDTDVENDALTITSNTDPSNGSLGAQTLAASKTSAADFQYTPNPDFNGTDTFTYTISDGNGGSATATVTITVNPIQDAPVANDDTGETSLDRSVTVDALANDSDADSEPLTITITTQPSNGSAEVNDAGTATDPTDDTVVYTPNAGYFNLGDGVDLGPDTFTYTITDGTDSATATVSIVVLENNPPTTVGDSATTTEDAPVNLNPLTNDSDPDGEALSIGAVSDPPSGTATFSGHTVTYTPDPNFNGSDSFTYDAVDERGGTTQGTITITITAVNDPPRAAPDQASTDKNTPVTVAVLANDADIDGDTISLVSSAAGKNGTTKANADGTVTYTPKAGFFGSDTFEYVVSDGKTTSRGAVQVTVRNVNLAPIAANDSATTAEDTAVSINFLSNDSDPDADVITVSTVGTAADGTVTDNADGTATYAPNADFNGTDSFTYTIEDPKGLTSTATVTITVTPVNDAPVAVSDTRKAFEGTTAAYTPLDNDTDLEGDELEITTVGAAGLGTTTLVDSETIGYVPPAGFNGTDTFTYTIDDGNGGTASATVTITVEALPPDDDGVEEAVEASAPNNGDGNGDGLPDAEQANVASLPSASTGTFITVASDAGSELTAVTSTATNPTSEEPPAEAEFPAGFLDYELKGGTGDAARTVTITLESGEFNSYFKFGPTPDNTTPHWYNFLYDGKTGAVINGNTITLHFVDGLRGDDDLTVNGTIVDPGGPAKIPNEAPVAAPDNITTNEDTPVTFNVVDNDSDEDGDALVISSTTRPNKGRRVRTGNVITYTPNANFNGTDAFTYVVSDGKGGSVTAKVTITVISVNDPPIAVDDAFTTEEDTDIVISGLLSNDTDVESTTLTLGRVQAAQEGLIVVSNTGTVTYRPKADFSGTDRFTYTVSDGEATSIGTATVTITAVNDAPVANPDIVALDDASSSATVAVLANDTDVEGDALTVSAVGAPGHGTASLQGDGSILYTPGTTFGNQDTFTYTVTDAEGASSEGTVSIALGAVAPNALADEGATDEDTPVIIDVRANDLDPNGDAITVVTVSDPANGTATIDADGNVLYSPDKDFNGSDNFTYEVSDGGLTSSATVTVTIAAINDAPRFEAGSPVFTAPANGADVAIGNSNPDTPAGRLETIDFAFNGAVDPEGTSISYTWDLSAESDMTTVLFSQELEETSFSIRTSEVATLMDGEPGATLAVYHRITASDGELETRSAIESATLIRGYITGVDGEDLPTEYELFQNYPNPFNPVTQIRFALPQAGQVSLEVFDTVGRKVATLVNSRMAPGYHDVVFDGAQLPSGIYLYLLRTDGYSASRSLVLLK